MSAEVVSDPEQISKVMPGLASSQSPGLVANQGYFPSTVHGWVGGGGTRKALSLPICLSARCAWLQPAARIKRRRHKSELFQVPVCQRHCQYSTASEHWDCFCATAALLKLFIDLYSCQPALVLDEGTNMYRTEERQPLRRFVEQTRLSWNCRATWRTRLIVLSQRWLYNLALNLVGMSSSCFWEIMKKKNGSLPLKAGFLKSLAHWWGICCVGQSYTDGVHKR